MKDARAGMLDIVACWRFDRFARSVRRLMTALDELNARASALSFVDVQAESARTTADPNFLKLLVGRYRLALGHGFDV